MASTFKGLLDESVGMQVQLQRGGPELATGTLRYVGDDFLVVESDDGEVVLYPFDSIHALSTMTEPKNDEPKEPVDPRMLPLVGEEETKIDISAFTTLSSVLAITPKKLVKLGKEGPGSIRGLVLDVQGDYICMVSDLKEIIYVPFKGVSSITLNPGRKKNDKNSQKSSTEWMQWFK